MEKRKNPGQLRGVRREKTLQQGKRSDEVNMNKKLTYEQKVNIWTKS